MMMTSVMLPDNPTLEEYTRLLNALGVSGQLDFSNAKTPEELEAKRIEYLGDQRGKLREFQIVLGRLAKEARPEAGRQFNAAKAALGEAHEKRRQELAQASTSASRRPVDPSMPARHQWRGAKHPVTLVIEEIEDIFRELGFTAVTGPEAETEGRGAGNEDQADQKAHDANGDHRGRRYATRGEWPV